MTVWDFVQSIAASVVAVPVTYGCALALKALTRIPIRQKSFKAQINEARALLKGDPFPEFRNKVLSASFIVAATTATIFFYLLFLSRISLWFGSIQWAAAYQLAAYVMGMVGSGTTMLLLGRIAKVNETIVEYNERKKRRVSPEAAARQDKHQA